MSFDLLKTAKHVKGLSNAEFRVLFMLLEAANNGTYECFPSIREIASFTDMEERTVQRHISALADKGLFERIAQRRDDGSRAVNCYRFVITGTVQIGKQELVVINGHKPQPARNGGLRANNPPFRTPPPVENDTTPRPDCRDISLESSLESSLEPLSLTGEAPSQDLLDGVDQAPAPVRITEHVLNGWAKLAEQFPRIQRIRVLNDARKRKIGARAAEVIRGAGSADLTPHAVWDQIFAAIRGSPFLRGEADPGRGYTDPMSLNIDYILRPAEFLRTLERAATDADHNRVTSDPATGRRFGPAEQAGREALQRYLAGKQRR